CISEGAPDVAFVPLTTLSESLVWPVCNAAPKSRRVNVFGFGLNRGRLPGQLLMATMMRQSALAGLEIAGSDAAQWVEAGDSGGPVTLTSAYAQTAPTVCFVVAGSTLIQGTGEISSFLQPVWGIWNSLSSGQ